MNEKQITLLKRVFETIDTMEYDNDWYGSVAAFQFNDLRDELTDLLCSLGLEVVR